MNRRLLVLLLLLSAARLENAPPEAGPRSKADKINSYYRRQVKRVKAHHQQMSERNLQQVSSPHLRFLPTNITSIRQLGRGGNPLANNVRGFLQRLRSGRIDRNFVTRQLLRIRLPLFNRFRLRRNDSNQMRCSLSMRVEGMQNFFQIGVVLIRLTFFSSCMDNPFTKFIWVNNFESTSHFRLRIGNRSYLLLFGNTVSRPSQFQEMVHYDSYKLLSLFRGQVWDQSMVGRRGGRRQSNRRRQVVTRRTVRARNLRDDTLETKAKVEPTVPQVKKAKVKTDSSVAERELRRRRRRRRRGRARNRRRRRRNRRRRRRRQRRQRRRRQQPVRRQPTVQWWRPPPQQRPRQQPAKPQPYRAQPFKPTVVDLPTGERGPDRVRNLHRSFTNLLNRNDESGHVFARRINEPINILPRVEWRPVGRRREILSGGSASQPFWRLRVIRRIWRGQNPQIAPARPIPVLRDSIVTMSL